MQNKNNIEVLNCKANIRPSYTTKTQQYFTLHVEKIQGMESFIIIKDRLDFLNKNKILNAIFTKKKGMICWSEGHRAHLMRLGGL